MAFGNIFHDNFKVFLLLIVSILPLASTQVDCNGKGFHCLNTTHFQICVDIGNGISTTVDEFIIPCPPALGCYPDNHFECEFHPVPTVAPVSTKDYFFEDTSDVTAVFNETVLVNNAPELNKSETELLKNYFDNATDETISNTAPTLHFVKKPATGLPDFNITEANNSELLTTLQNNKKDDTLKDSIQTTISTLHDTLKDSIQTTISTLQTDFTHATTMTYTTTASYDPTTPIKHSNIEIETSTNGTHLSHLLKDLSDLAQSYITLGASHNHSQNTSVSESTTVSYIDKYPSINTESTFSLPNESTTDFSQTIVNEYQMTNSDAVTAVSNQFTLNPLENILSDKVLNKTSAVNLNSFDTKSVQATTIQASDSNNTSANKKLTPTNSDLLKGSNNQPSSTASTSILLNKNKTTSYTEFPSTMYEVNFGGNVFPLLNDPTTEVPQSAVKEIDQGTSVTTSDAVTPDSNIFSRNQSLDNILIDKTLSKATTNAVNLDNFVTESFETTTMSALGSKQKKDKNNHNIYEGDSMKSLNNQSITNFSTAVLPDARTNNDSTSVVNSITQKSTSEKPLKSTNTLEFLDSTYGMTNEQKTHPIVKSSPTHSTKETTIVSVTQTNGTEKTDLFNTENPKFKNHAENALKSNKNITLTEHNYTPESNPLETTLFDKTPISDETNKPLFTTESDKFTIAENALKSTDTPDILDSTYGMTNVQKKYLTDMSPATHSTIETTIVSAAQTTGAEKTDLFNTLNPKIKKQAENSFNSNKNNTWTEPNYTPESNPLENILFDKKPISYKTNKPSFTTDSEKLIIAENALKSTDTPDSTYDLMNVQKTHPTDISWTTHSIIETTIVSVAQTTGTEKMDLFNTENAKLKNHAENSLNSNKNNTLTEPNYTPESNPLENILFDKKSISDDTNKPSFTTDSDKFIIAEKALQFTDTPYIIDSTNGTTNVHKSYPSEMSMTTLPSIETTDTTNILDSTYVMTNVQKTYLTDISSATYSTIETTIVSVAETTGTEKTDLFNTENPKLKNQAENALNSNKNNTLTESNYTTELNPLENILFDKKPISDKSNKPSYMTDSDTFIIAEYALKSTDTPDIFDSTYDLMNLQKTHPTDISSTTHSIIETTIVSVAETTGTEKMDLFNTENADLKNHTENALKSNKKNTLTEPHYTPESNPLENALFDKKSISDKTNKPFFTTDSDKFIIAENALKSTDTPDILDSTYDLMNMQKTNPTDISSTTHSIIETTIVSVAKTTGTEKKDLINTENAKLKNHAENALNSNKNNTLTEPNYYTSESNPLKNILFDKKPISDKTNKPSIMTDSDKFIIAENALQFTDTPYIIDSTNGTTNVHKSYPSEMSMTTLPSIETTVVSVAQSINRENTDSMTRKNVNLVSDAENTFQFTNTIDILDSTYGTTNVRKTYPADMPMTTTRPIIETTIVSNIQNINSLPEKTILMSSSTEKSMLETSTQAGGHHFESTTSGPTNSSANKKHNINVTSRTNVSLKNLTPKTKYYETTKASTLIESSTLLNTLETTEELYSTTNKPDGNRDVANIKNNLNSDSINQVSASDYNDSTKSSIDISRLSLLNTSNGSNHATMLPYLKPIEQAIQKATDLLITESVKNVVQSTDEVTNKINVNSMDEAISNELYENTYNIISTTNNPTLNNDILENFTNINSYHVTKEVAQTLPTNIFFTTKSKSSLLAEELPTKATKLSINEKTSEIRTESTMTIIMPNTYVTELQSLSTINSIDLTEKVIKSGKTFTDIDRKNENIHKEENGRLDVAPDLLHTTRKHIPSEVTTTVNISIGANTSNKSHIAIASNLSSVAPEVITDPTASNLPPNTNNNLEISYNNNKLVGKETVTSKLLIEFKENRESINIKNNGSKSNLDLTQERSDYLNTNTTKNTTSLNAIFETITEPTKSTSRTSLKEYEIITNIEDVISEFNIDKDILSVNRNIASQTQTLRPSNQKSPATPGSASQITVQPSTMKAKPNIHKTEDISSPTNAGSLSGTNHSTPISYLSMKGNQGVIHAIDANLSFTNRKLGTTSTNYVSLSTANMNLEDIRKNKDASPPKSKVVQKPTGLVFTNAETHATYDESMNINVESVNLNRFQEKNSKTLTPNKVEISVKNKILSNKIVNETFENLNMPYNETMSSTANKKTIHLVPLKPYIHSGNNNPSDVISPTPSNQQSSSMNIATSKDLTYRTLLPITTYLNTAVVNKDEQTKPTISISKTSMPEKSSPINIENSSYQNIVLNRNITDDTHKNDSFKEVTRPRFICPNVRGKYGDGKDCRVYYVCLGPMRKEPITGLCPVNTVFSEIFKQCTKNLSHCIRNNIFQCISEGRFSDFLKDDIYYICVRNANQHFIRFKLQCEKGWKLNKKIVKCEKSSQQSSTYVSKSERSEIVYSEKSERDEKESERSKTEKSEKSERDEKESDGSETEKSEKSDNDEKENKKLFKCKKEGKFADKDDCAKYYVCAKNSKGDLIRKKEKCKKDYIFHKSKKKCVDEDSYECET